MVPLVRGGEAWGAVKWQEDGTLRPADVSGFDAVVHLAGEPVATGRWTAEKKRKIRESRVDSTQRLVEALERAGEPPSVLVCASGINFYGDHGDSVVTETTPAGKSFLAQVCVAWESAANCLTDLSRVVTLRLGAVLTPEGGTLAAMVPLFRSGLAGPIAGGRAWVSWVTLRDAARAIAFAIEAEALHGPVNVVSPEPVTGAEFTREVAAAVGRPAVVPVPGWAAKLMLGELAEETVLTSIRGVPERLLAAGFVFHDAGLTEALAGFGLQSQGKG